MKNFVLIISVCLVSCIGTDEIDDPIVSPVLTIDQELVTLLIGDSQQITFSYFDKFGQEAAVAPDWSVENPQVATISSNGQVTAIGKGQTVAIAEINGTVSNQVMINVAENESDVVKVLIESTNIMTLEIGEELQLQATAWSLSNMAIEGLPILWTVNDENVATINEDGLLVGHSSGIVSITATISGVKSAVLALSVGTVNRMAIFSSRSGYKAEGTAILQNDSNGDLILTFSSDFKTSFALGTFIYMSNSESGSDTKASGLELGEITSNGAKTFNISNKNSNATLATYRYVIILCRPASITFGVADFDL